MMTLRQFSAEPSTIPTITSWYLADLSKAQGKQELFTHQLPQKLKILREHALINPLNLPARRDGPSFAMRESERIFFTARFIRLRRVRSRRRVRGE